MASIYMKIEGLDKITGAATTEIKGKKGYFAIESFSWGAVRNIVMDIGNVNNADKGMAAFGEMRLVREYDGATPYISTFLLAPGNKGRDVSIVQTVPENDGEAFEPILIINLTDARVSEYNISSHDGSRPTEGVSLTYTAMEQVYYIEDKAGKITKGSVVKYDLSEGKATSKADF